MVQAIVFLPLLGAILAGLIAIFGAHTRNPSGDAVEHHDDGHGAHGHAADAEGDHGHDDHHVSEPPAQGSRAAELITTGLLMISAALSWVTLVDVGFMHHDARIVLFPWINSGDLQVSWALRLDTLTAVMLVGSIDFETIFAGAPGLTGKTINFFGWHADALTLTCLLLFMGAMGKSAQFLLHTWLPDAMEGPTPVSALIHAATMVTAGVFMVARLSPLFELAPNAKAVVMFFVATTAFFAATIGLLQNDIKRIVAYSTCSQLGYMFVAMGAGAYSVGIFHLFTHAFFKALLFLGSGSVIYGMHHEQDIRNMGGLWRKIPFTFFVMCIGTLALTGFPLTAGYFSKDAIIESAYVSSNPLAFYGFLMTVIAAGLTAFYSWRLMFKTFFGEPRDPEHYEAAHESPLWMLIPIGILAAGSILAGFPFKELFAGHGVEEFFRDSLKMHPLIIEEMEAAPEWIKLLPTVMMAIGAYVSYGFYIRRPYVPSEVPKQP